MVDTYLSPEPPVPAHPTAVSIPAGARRLVLIANWMEGRR